MQSTHYDYVSLLALLTLTATLTTLQVCFNTLTLCYSRQNLKLASVY